MWAALVDLIRVAIFAAAHVCGGSLGAAIVAVSVVVRVALLPLTLRLARQAREQQARLAALKPKMDALQRRHAGDPARLAREVRALHAANGIRLFTPRGLVGFLVQAPLLGGLFAAVRGGLGARTRFLWIADLSRPDALLVSNGPGDPRQATDAIQCIRDLLGQLPIFGICMGIQVCALALGGETYKLKFGHRGANQPVRFKDGRIFMTTQNHGFAVDAGSLPEGCRVTYTNVNDNTLEGFENRDLDLTTVQFHPEAHGGPLDTEAHFFDAMFRRLS